MKTFLVFVLILMFGITTPGDKILVNATADQIVEKIAEFKNEKPVLVNFWATWCAPCIEEFPFLMKLNKEYEGQFKLIFVSGDFEEAREDAVAFLKKQGVDFETYFKVGKDNDFITTISNEWTGALPFTIVYNKKGEVSAAWEGKAEFETFESELLNVINED
ncbi:MAG: alkyl hydroperoxide reductase [Balneola sp.]|jgi:thiol-disulfide isomerase/thioredoxin|nr:alkyl hydroperoxide reductase [Balneola sp.]MBE79488.1 alkyl hydroperoxide reductase [Balneola sp.]|tara:strand:- start:96 stop:581 length:486 start_codon:yes stop_codon:yes gene_type:complete